ATTWVQRTTPVSVSTWTSAICTPPTWTLDRPAVHLPLARTMSMPSLAQASFQVYFLLLALSTTWPGSMLRSPLSHLSLGASLSKKSSRAEETALSAAGAVPGQVVLPPEPLDGP